MSVAPQVNPAFHSMSLDHSDPSLSDLLKKLQIPADYARIEHMTSPILELDRWKLGVHSVLDQILRLVKSDEELSLEDQGDIVFASSPFAIDFPVQPDQLPEEHEKSILENWVTPDARRIAQGIIFVFFITNNKMTFTIDIKNYLLFRCFHRHLVNFWNRSSLTT